MFKKMTVHLVSVTMEELRVPTNKFKFTGNVIIFTSVPLPDLWPRLEGWRKELTWIRGTSSPQQLTVTVTSCGRTTRGHPWWLIKPQAITHICVCKMCSMSE